VNLIELLLLGKIFGPRGNKGSTKSKSLHGDELGNLYCVGRDMTEVAVGCTCRLMWGYKKNIPTTGEETSFEVSNTSRHKGGCGKF
jgi:hypothetical protein